MAAQLGRKERTEISEADLDFELDLPLTSSFLMQAKLEGLYVLEEEDELEECADDRPESSQQSQQEGGSGSGIEDWASDDCKSRVCSEDWSELAAAKANSPLSVLETRSDSTSCHTEEFAGPEIINVEVAIVGGGLGGLALAVGLRRRGFDAHVFEEAPSAAGEGSTLFSLKPEGVRALVGIYPRAEEVVAACSVLLDKAALIRVAEGGVVTEAEEQGSAVVQWSRARGALTDLLPYDAVHCSHSFRHYEPLNGAVEAHFAVTAPEARTVLVRAGLLVGADGRESLVRRQLSGGGEATSGRRGYLYWGGKTPISQDSLHDYPKPRTGCHVHDEEKGLFGSLVNTGDGQLYWQVCKVDPEGKLAKSFGDPGEDWGGRGQWGAKGRVLQFVDSTSKHLQPLWRAVRISERSAITEGCVSPHPVLHRWSDHDGRVVLLGDAAETVCPVTGDGAMLALEDALSLAQELEDAVNLNLDANVERAVYRYETLRMARRQQVARQLAGDKSPVHHLMVQRTHVPSSAPVTLAEKLRLLKLAIASNESDYFTAASFYGRAKSGQGITV